MSNQTWHFWHLHIYIYTVKVVSDYHPLVLKGLCKIETIFGCNWWYSILFCFVLILILFNILNILSFSVEIIEDELNLSVTDEDLQNLDNANTLVTRYRKIKPPRCTLLLEKTLKLQVESLHKIKTNVHGVKPIGNPSFLPNLYFPLIKF